MGEEQTNEGTPPGDVEWIVTVEEKYRAQIGDVTAALESAGLRVDRVLKTLGIVCGSAGGDCRVVFASIEGVASVDAERSIRIAPPDSDVQ
ncbi:ketohydroxyglutarate aldolase [Zhihengliuella halotolerans]|uniref:ketohydroxyglutarate aldolase n=1 Tax=Zhihengliuella halotolerans TaxID=370736 RepID=UPI000C7FE478|nr:ketohydroxyglutarate aldolase [Zhihengliuella halotolerans]